MIVNDGKYHIKRYMAGQVPQIAKAISFGIGDTAATLADRRLKFEIGRAPVKSIAYDQITNQLIFKATLPAELEGRICEIGLWSDLINKSAASMDRLLVRMDSTDEEWSNDPVWATTNNRVGEDSLRQAPLAGAAVSNEISLGTNLSDYSPLDIIAMPYFNLNTNTSSIQVKFKTDNSNYYSFTIATPAAGYSFFEIAKGSLVVTGVPSWSSIEKIEIITTAKAAVTAQVDIDAIQVIDNDFVNPAYLMIARNVLTTPFNVVSGSINEVEYALSVTV